MGRWPDGAAYDSANGNLYVSNRGSSNVSVINGSTNTVVATIPLPWDEPVGAAYDSSNGDIYVSEWNQTSFTNVSVISGSTNRVVANISVGDREDSATYDPSNGDVYVTLWARGNVSVINGSSNTVVATVPVGLVPSGGAYDSSNGDVYIANTYSHNVSVIHGTKIVATVPVGSAAGPQDVAYDSTNGDIYVTNTFSNRLGTVSVINGSSNTVVATVPVGLVPNGAAYDPADGDVYVANIGSNNVSVVAGSTNKIVATIPGGDEPWAVAYDPSNGEVYVTNYLSGNVSVICGSTESPATYTVSFIESGLPFGTNWSVTLSGDTESSTATAIGYSETNGTYSYSIGSVMGYTASPLSGNLAVSGNSVTESITFSLVNLTTYAVTFTESGLTLGTSWSVTLNNVTARSTTATIGFAEANGRYPYRVGSVTGYAVSPSTGNLTVSGSAVRQEITFFLVNATEFSVAFTESGLPSGTSWAITLGGVTRSSTTSTIGFTEANGTFTYSVGVIPGYSSSPSSGSVGVAGRSSTLDILFTAAGGTGGSASSPGFLGLPGSTGFLVIGGLTAAVGVAVALILRSRRPQVK